MWIFKKVAGDMNKFGHVINDVLLYHAHTYFAWSLVHIGFNSGMVTSTSTSRHLSPSLDEDVLASWTTLFEGGGDDVGQPNDNTLSSTPTYDKPPRTPKGGKELHELQSTKAYAWMRRRKRHGQGEEEGGEDRQAGPQAGTPPEPAASQPA